MLTIPNTQHTEYRTERRNKTWYYYTPTTPHPVQYGTIYTTLQGIAEDYTKQNVWRISRHFVIGLNIRLTLIVIISWKQWVNMPYTSPNTEGTPLPSFLLPLSLSKINLCLHPVNIWSYKINMIWLYEYIIPCGTIYSQGRNREHGNPTPNVPCVVSPLSLSLTP